MIPVRDEYLRRKTSNSTFWIVVLIAIAVFVIIVQGHRNGSLSDSEPQPPSTEIPAPRQTEKPIEKPINKKAAALAAAKEAAQAEHDRERIRIAHAKLMENNLLGNGFNVDVIAGGPKHTHLTMKWILASKSLAFQFTEQQQDTLQQLKEEGFKRFTITDGYDQSWNWKLDE